MKKKILALGLVALLGLGATINPDQYDVLFCKANGTTTTFVDSSTANPKTITANGNATQLSLHADFAGKRTAGFFNGTSDYIVVPQSTDFAFDGACSFIFYVNHSSLTNAIYFDGGYAANKGVTLYHDGTNLQVALNGGTLGSFARAWSRTVNVWYKIELSRDGSDNWHLKVDDVQLGADYAKAGTITATNDYWFGYRATGAYLHGWMKNLTITKAGTTVLDMKFDSPATSPLGAWISMDGSGDSISVADSDDWNMTDFTVDGFYKFDNTSSAQAFWGTAGTTDAEWVHANWNNGTGNVEVWVSGTTGSFSFTPVANKSYHLAMVRSSGTTKFYIDGRDVGLSLSNSDTLAPTNPIHFGVRDTIRLTGSVREIRISNTARYTSAFTPSQTGFTVDANTKLYIKGDEDNGVTTFIDQTGKTVTTNGDTKIKYTEDYRSCIFKDDSASAHKPYPVGSAKVDFFSAFGSGVGYFDGVDGSMLTLDDSTDWDFGTEPFSMELYARFSSIPSQPVMIDLGGYANGVRIVYYSNNLQAYIVGNARNIASWVPLANTWYHLMVTRDATNIRGFVNGTLGNTIADSGNVQTSTGIRIGDSFDGATDEVVGLMDNIRISKGVARYTATFNPPADFPQTGSKRKKASSWWFFF